MPADLKKSRSFLCGVVFSSGAMSKDEILAVAWRQNQALFWVGVFTAFLTAFYMGRLFVVAFTGRARNSAAEHARENGLVMILPLMILALFSVRQVWQWIAVDQLLQSVGAMRTHEIPEMMHGLLLLVPFLGLALAFAFYRNAPATDPLALLAPRLHRLIVSRFGFDELYDGLVRYGQGGVATLLRIFDVWVVDGLGVRGTSFIILVFGNFLRCFQTGNLQTYVIYVAMAMVALIWWIVIG